MSPRNFNGEARAFARRRAHINLMVQDFSQSPDDRKTQAEAATRHALCPLIVLLEDVRQLIVGNADAAIPDFDANLVAGASAAQQYLAAIGVSNRIRQQISDHLLQHAPVALDHES